MFELGRLRINDEVASGIGCIVLTSPLSIVAPKPIEDEPIALSHINAISVGLVELTVDNCLGLPSNKRRCKPLIFLQKNQFHWVSKELMEKERR